MTEEKRYYLNNISEQPIQIVLTAKRTINAFSSLPLNKKDIELFKKQVAKRKGNLGVLVNLKLSTIKIEDDARYGAKDFKAPEQPVDHQMKELKDTNPDEPLVLDDTNKPEDNTDKESEDTEVKNPEDASQPQKSAEELAKEELEKKAKEELEKKASEGTNKTVLDKIKDFI